MFGSICLAAFWALEEDILTGLAFLGQTMGEHVQP